MLLKLHIPFLYFKSCQYAAIIRAVTAVMEQGDIPVCTKCFREFQQCAGCFREFKTEQPLLQRC